MSNEGRIETTLAKTLTAAEGMKAYDDVCKRVLVNREILVWIMQNCMEGFNITMTEILERGIEEMCNLSKGVAERGFLRGLERGLQQGIEQETMRSIQSLMQTLHLTVEQAMEALKIEASKRSVYAEKLKVN